MRCLTIRQPWATLVALGEKNYETRSWRTAYRGELAIHAGLKIDKAACGREPFQSILAKHGYTEENLPTGVIIATGKLKECHDITGLNNVAQWMGENERALGDYTEGRFAWELENVRPLVHHVPAKGRLGFWEYPLSEEEEHF
ncbi:2-oxoglutarate dehydrogenase E1 [Bacillus sp. FJAT-27264]|uniref:ASCH domain-containing protein n=1 Tax=Paenibacillus sp. (strain DSM 101736 / FJAT-27264) TaxID=1850362 RepID=UPI000808145B|nr:ASCH domain-containing protein [Bacillus sp. FJAT-27264]OBZ10535.1 2-oxoglutarate dehydrogenase E1 [Bacillus sp. FJAT-27264]